MAYRWWILLIGVAFIQAASGLSPIPVPEEEWEDFYRMMRDSGYRLPKTTFPRHYEVTLTPYFDNPPPNVSEFTFDGSVVIYTTAMENNVNEIVIHCNDLIIDSLTVESGTLDITAPNQTFVCEMPYSFLRIQTSQPLFNGAEYIIRSTFRGRLQDNMRGFYKSWYIDSTGKRWMGTTQFQPGHARQAFPCYDEPGFKATFDITIIRDADFKPSISNMPIKETFNLTNGKVSETFFTSPKTSTYLLAFIVSHYEKVASNNDTVRPFDIYARNNIGSDGDWALQIGEKLLLEMETYTDYPYYNMAPSLDMKQAAIPDFSAGAMENWGLLTYREANILYDELNSNHFYRQRVANIVAHEIAHMWFGNLVTCEWWDVLWLNEGFARFYQYFLTERVAPEMEYGKRFITEQLHVSMLQDSIDSAHPLTDRSVEDPSSVSGHFSTITYAKGASVLRMTQYLMGEDTYLKALRAYLKARDFDVASPNDLFLALDQAAAEDNALAAYGGITIAEYLRTWSEQAGHPMLTVTVDQKTGRMTVTQVRFNRNNGVSSIPTLYHIPITWTRGGAPDFNNTKPVAILTSQAHVLQRGTTGNEWVIFNKQNTGFYRVNYDRVNWALITQALRGSQRINIHEYNRAQIVDDLFVFARARVMPYNLAMNILSFLEFEDAFAPWEAAITGFNFVIRRVIHEADSLEKLRAEITKLSTAVVAKLGYIEIPGESYMNGLQRMNVMDLPANMRPWVYCEGLRQGNADDWNFFWNQYLQKDLANDQVVMLQNAGCTSDQASLERYLDEIVSLNDTVRPQDMNTAINSAITGNQGNELKVFEWLKRNIPQATLALGSIATPLNNIAGRLVYEQDIVAFENWVTENRAELGESLYATGMNGAATARNNLAWSANRIGELAAYLETGYAEEEIPDIEEEVDPSTPVTPAPTTSTTTPAPDVPDSANLAAVSVFALVLTLAVNLLA
ncbi:peptidase family m1 domain-containing protein [Phthorimaea operculella]|nr:peptidase family m1 domain-containing protein [Phthorimaea operculella]